ncbi:MAG: hypothetical protein CML13_06830 [Puniceicoccaceae bacterium]|nr:hypothetical protein [Puniceicoccaceae bacterium]|tara:strand:- start:3 stop:425 length:423 start_codon:yes stop_codon:yes gene_type:complete
METNDKAKAIHKDPDSRYAEYAGNKYYDYAVAGMSLALNDAYRSGLTDQFALLQSDKPITIWGNKPESVMRALDRDGYTVEGITSIMLSCGLNFSLQEITEILKTSKEPVVDLTEAQHYVLFNRAQLFIRHVKLAEQQSR